MKIFKKIIINTFIIAFIFIPIFSFAQINIPVSVQNPIRCPAGQDCDDLMTVINRLLNEVVLPIGAVLCVVWIIYAGFKFVEAQGNETKLTKAKSTLLWALVGTGILLGATGISEVVKNTVTSVVNY